MIKMRKSFFFILVAHVLLNGAAENTYAGPHFDSEPSEVVALGNGLKLIYHETEIVISRSLEYNSVSGEIRLNEAIDNFSGTFSYSFKNRLFSGIFKNTLPEGMSYDEERLRSWGDDGFCPLVIFTSTTEHFKTADSFFSKITSEGVAIPIRTATIFQDPFNRSTKMGTEDNSGIFRVNYKTEEFPDRKNENFWGHGYYSVKDRAEEDPLSYDPNPTFYDFECVKRTLITEDVKKLLTENHPVQVFVETLNVYPSTKSELRFLCEKHLIGNSMSLGADKRLSVIANLDHSACNGRFFVEHIICANEVSFSPIEITIKY